MLQNLLFTFFNLMRHWAAETFAQNPYLKMESEENDCCTSLTSVSLHQQKLLGYFGLVLINNWGKLQQQY